MTDYTQLARYIGNMVGKSFKSKNDFTNEMLSTGTSSTTYRSNRVTEITFHKDGKPIGNIWSDGGDPYSTYANDYKNKIRYSNPNEKGQFTTTSFCGCTTVDANENGVLDPEDEITLLREDRTITIREFLSEYLK